MGGKTWQGPSGGEWVQLDAGAGEKPGWLLIEGPGFNQPGPLLEKVEPGAPAPLVITLYSLITKSDLCEVCIGPDHNIKMLKNWVALRDPHNLKAAKVLVARKMPSDEEQGS